MGSTSSSALRDEAAFGSLASMGARKLKKKPVLVLDPEELAQAHLLFQQGAAEQLGEFEPENRPRATVSLFGLAPMSEDDGEDMFALSPLNDDDEDDFEEAEAPAPDKVLSLTRTSAPRPSISATFNDSFAPQSEPEEATNPLLGQRPEQAPQPRFSEHLFGSRAEPSDLPKAPLPKAPLPPEFPAPRPTLVRDLDDVAPAVAQDDDDWPEVPGFAPQREEPQPSFNPIVQAYAEPELDDAIATVIVFEDEYEAEPEPPRPAPEPIEPMPAIQNSLRARLVREDVCLAQPEPTRWQQVVRRAKRWLSALTGR